MADLTVVSSEPLPSLSVVSSQPLPAAAPKTDDDIIRANGFDPAVVKSSHLYVPGHLLSVATDSAPHGTDFAGTAAKGLDEMGQGVYNVPAGLFQFAVHAANKLGIASDADVQYNDLLEKVHRQAYLARVGADHSIIPELAGGALIPIPGGAAKTLLGALAKGAAVGAGAALAQPATNVAPGADYFAPKATQTAIGAATGGAAGALTGGVARVLSSRSVELPEQLAARAQTGGAEQVLKLEDAMQTTPFAGAADVAKAADAGDRAAIALRDEMAQAKTPGQILQASIGLQNWRTRQTAAGLYDKVQQLVKGHRQLADVPLDQTEQTISDALNQAEKAKDPDVSLIKMLRTYQRNIGASADPQASDALVDNSYGQIRQFRSDVGDRIRDLRTGEGKLLAPSAAATLQGVRNAIDTDLRNFTTESGAQDVQRAADEADRYYAKNRVPFGANDISKAGAPNLAGSTTAAEPDQIFNAFIKAGRGDKAQRFFDALDPRGRAAVQYQMAADAMNQATDQVTGAFDPMKFFNAMDNTKQAYGVFFSGPAKASMDGLKNLAQQAVLATNKEAARGKTLENIAKGTGAGAAAAGLAGAHPVAYGLGGIGMLAGAARGLMLSDAGRRLLADASSLKPGDPRLAAILDTVSRQFPATAARAATPAQ